MRQSVSKRFLKMMAAPVLALAALAAGCERGAESRGGEERAVAAPAPAAAPSAASAPSAAGAPSQSKPQEVGIDNFSFNPPTMTVTAGATVTWVNHDDVPHTVTANDKGFASKALDTDDRFTHVFTAPGTYSYFCAVHPHMTGQIIVK
jgi:plastocyanin